MREAEALHFDSTYLDLNRVRCHSMISSRFMISFHFMNSSRFMFRAVAGSRPFLSEEREGVRGDSGKAIWGCRTLCAPP